MPEFTENQSKAIGATGNVLVMAGAGTGKTRTLVERAVRWAAEPGNSLDEILMVTFTEAAAAEMRSRIRAELEARIPRDANRAHLVEQLGLLDSTYIGTLHSFCFQIIKENFYVLNLDPDVRVLDATDGALLADEAMTSMLAKHYEGSAARVAAIHKLAQNYCQGREAELKKIIRRLHTYSQTLPDPERWFRDLIYSYEQTAGSAWRELLPLACSLWRERWLPELLELPEHELISQCIRALRRLSDPVSIDDIRQVLECVAAADAGDWKKQKKIIHDPVRGFFQEAEFLLSLLPGGNEEVDPIEEDWGWCRQDMLGFLELAGEFGRTFSRMKREAGRLDFHDLEQLTLDLLWNRESEAPTAAAVRWRKRLRLIFVDEYQDINAAQDCILRALGGEGSDANRFLVGDIKQSIYRFRLAAPAIFRGYMSQWRGNSREGRVIPLADNFRSDESILNFINKLFGCIMRRSVGGVEYDAEAELRFGGGPKQSPRRLASPMVKPRVMLELFKEIKRPSSAEDEEDVEDLTAVERQARFIASHLRHLRESGYEIWDAENNTMRGLAWGDIVVLLRSPSRKTEIYAREFARLAIPLRATRGSFFESQEMRDVLSLLTILDNPLQDVPLLTVLRSPLAGFTADELAQIRTVEKRTRFWMALKAFRRISPPCALLEKTRNFLDRYQRWRLLIRRGAVGDNVERILLESQYEAWVLAQPGGSQRSANLQKLRGLTRQYDRSQHRGLYRFLRFIEAQDEAGLAEEPAPLADTDAVRLMSIHQSKGLEFPCVVLADLEKRWNLSDLNAPLILDEEYGLCPRIKPPSSTKHYPSLPYWMAQKTQRREMIGEELRLLYVALTRARDSLILVGTVTETKLKLWRENPTVSPSSGRIQAANSWLDWFGPWLHTVTGSQNWPEQAAGQSAYLQWRIQDSAEISAPRPSAYEEGAREDSAIKAAELISWTYPWKAAIQEPAKGTVTALRRRISEEQEAAPWARRAVGSEAVDGAARGQVHHLFLQLASLAALTDESSLRAEAKLLEESGILQPTETKLLEFGALGRFWQSKIGLEIRKHWHEVQREVPFTARFTMGELADLGFIRPETVLEGEFIVVQGIADLVVRLDSEIWLLDFKTDQILELQLQSKIRDYKPQMALYARALERVFNLSVTRRWLHFFAIDQTCEL